MVIVKLALSVIVKDASPYFFDGMVKLLIADVLDNVIIIILEPDGNNDELKVLFTIKVKTNAGQLVNAPLVILV